MVDVSTLQQSQLELGSIVGPEGCWFQVKVPRTGSRPGYNDCNWNSVHYYLGRVRQR
jgi:hypothetical protein